jgi:hopene-associated glycosyltransferase HpnB
MIWVLFALPAALAWTALLLLPWRPWSTRERLEPLALASPAPVLDDVVVLIPARDEAAMLPATLRGLARQGEGLAVVVVDDRSTDGTGAAARDAWAGELEVIDGRPLPPGWSGKVWAQEQGRGHLQRRLALLLDADIELEPGVVPALRAKLLGQGGGIVSAMAMLHATGPWSRWLLPAFVYFFKLLYPFRLAADPRSRVAAAAGGCVLVETAALERIGGFGALRGALIDDCTLARHLKAADHPAWIGLSSAVHSRRDSERLTDIWDMVARTAYTQLRYSPWWLLGCTVAMLCAFVAPLVVLIGGGAVARAVALAAFAAMLASYLPTLHMYRLGVWRAILLPFAGVAFLLMTWTSAVRHWRGDGARWRGRYYARSETTP